MGVAFSGENCFLKSKIKNFSLSYHIHAMFYAQQKYFLNFKIKL
jgi:hypothetical protein